jgi:C-terminal processing protease CtpA/Prc
VDDAITAIDSHPTAPMTQGELMAALHGASVDRHTLSLKRNGKELTVDVAVTAF